MAVRTNAQLSQSIGDVLKPGFGTQWADVRRLATDVVDSASSLFFGGGTINAAQYSPAGDGVTDDRTALQAALDAVPSTGGVVVFPPPAVAYYISGALVPKSGTTLAGAGWNTKFTCPTAGWVLVHPTNFGFINCYQKNYVRVTGMRFVGTTSADINHTPKFVFQHTASDITIDHCWFADSANEGIWQGGDTDNTVRTNVLDNYFDNVATSGLPAIQMNARQSVISRNQLTACGIAIGASGYNTIVSDNIIDSPTTLGIGTGDSEEVKGMVISNNQITLSGDNSTNRKAILIATGLEACDNVQVIGNSIRLTSTVGNIEPTAIMTSTGLWGQIANNSIEIVGFGSGIKLLGTTLTSTAVVDSNLVRVITEDAACHGITGVPNGNGKTLKVVTSNNRLFGFTRAKSSYAYDFNSTGGGTLNATMINDYTTQGYVRCGSTLHTDGEDDNLPINLTAGTG